MGTAPQLYICKTCRRVLDRHVDLDGVRWLHTMQDSLLADHEAEPIPAPEGYREGRCDFCGANHPEFELPVRDFTVPIKGMENHTSEGNWGACAPCAELIEANRWNALLARLLLTDPVIEAAMKRLWRAVRENISGGLRPIGK